MKRDMFGSLNGSRQTYVVTVPAFLLFFLISYSATGQKFTVKGQLLDTLANPLPSATAMLLNARDSSLVTFSVTDGNGSFSFKNINPGDYLLKATFIGFRNYTRLVRTQTPTSVLDLGAIRLLPLSKELEAVEITADRAPVVVKHDTIEFNAAAFKTKPNAVVEDLLKKLPGVQVDNEGNITAQGEQVRSVTVDGKVFFGNDPKLATRNLPADAVDKVQLLDKKSDQAQFSGIDDGQRQKTINLELKPEKRNGAFGNVEAGAGTDNRFAARTNINRFTKDRQLSFLGMGNNVNQNGFSMEEYMNFTGGSQRMMSGGAVRMEIRSDNNRGVPVTLGNTVNGIMDTYAGGINVNNTFNQKSELNGSYFFNYLDHQQEYDLVRQNFLPGNSFTFNQSSRSLNNNTNHRANFVLEHKLDSANSLKVNTAFTYNETESHIRSNSKNVTSEQIIQNESERMSVSVGTNQTFNGAFLWRHKFATKGRTFSANLQLGTGANRREGTLEAANHFYFPADSASQIRQLNFQNNTSLNYSASLSYSEPIGRRKYLEANYSYRNNSNEVERDVFDAQGDDKFLNATLSSSYNNRYEYQRGGLNMRAARNDFNVLLGVALQETNLTGRIRNSTSSISRSLVNILPVARVNVDFSGSKHLSLDYETAVREPEIQQIQPVVDNSDPLNIYKGNPGLRPGYEHSLRMNYTAFDPVTFMNLFLFADLDYTANAIVNAQSIDEQLIRTITPMNVDYEVRMRTDGNLGIPLSKINSRISLGTNFTHQRSIALLNDRPATVRQETVGASVQYNYRFKEVLDLNVSADKDRESTTYQFDQPGQLFITSSYSVNADFYFLKRYHLSSTFDLREYKNKQSDFRQTIPLLQQSLSRFLFKNNAGELKLSVTNLLNKTLGVNQRAGINYIERETINSLGRFVMLGFTYAINKQLNPMAVRRGGMMRIIR